MKCGCSKLQKTSLKQQKGPECCCYSEHWTCQKRRGKSRHICSWCQHLEKTRSLAPSVSAQVVKAVGPCLPSGHGHPGDSGDAGGGWRQRQQLRSDGAPPQAEAQGEETQQLVRTLESYERSQFNNSTFRISYFPRPVTWQRILDLWQKLMWLHIIRSNDFSKL